MMAGPPNVVTVNNLRCLLRFMNWLVKTSYRWRMRSTELFWVRTPYFWVVGKCSEQCRQCCSPCTLKRLRWGADPFFELAYNLLCTCTVASDRQATSWSSQLCHLFITVPSTHPTLHSQVCWLLPARAVAKCLRLGSQPLHRCRLPF